LSALTNSAQSSFGFGQVGGTALVIHPRYLLGSLEPSAYEAYKSRNHIRALQSYKAMSEMMITNSLVKIKEAPPYSTDMEHRVLMNPGPEDRKLLVPGEARDEGCSRLG